MKLTVKKYLNARTGSPTVEAPNLFYKNPGEVIEITEAVLGQEYEGSAIWYKADDGQFYWSGGFEEVGFSLGNSVSNLGVQSDALSILDEAVNYFKAYFSFNVAGFTGIGISQKIKSNSPLGPQSIVIQVASKITNPSFLIPSTIYFKGFEIATDVEQCSTTATTSPGRSTSRQTMHVFGTAGFYASKNNSIYLVTNYHVLCDDFMKNGTKSFSNEPLGLKINLPKISDTATATIGILSTGVLDSYKDVAQAKMNSPIHGNTNGAFTFHGYIPQRSIPPNASLEMMGSVSGYQSNISVKGTNYSEPINYGYFTHTLGGLIKLSLCSRKGDSGSPVIFQNKLVGILVAQDSHNSYCIPIENIIKPLNLIVL